MHIICRTWYLQQETPIRSLYPASFQLFRIPCSHPQREHMFLATSPDSLGMKERVFGSCCFRWRGGHCFTGIQSMHCHFHVNPHPKFLWVSKDLLWPSFSMVPWPWRLSWSIFSSTRTLQVQILCLHLAESGAAALFLSRRGLVVKMVCTSFLLNLEASLLWMTKPCQLKW